MFQALLDHGFALWSDQDQAASAPFLAAESFPSSAWRQLGLDPLPAKSKASLDHLQRASRNLRRLFPLEIPEGLSHDEMQALVASLAAMAVARGYQDGYATSGLTPTLLEGRWREGFILNPTPAALNSIT